MEDTQTDNPPLRLNAWLGDVSDLEAYFRRRGEWIDNLLRQRMVLRRVADCAHKNGLRDHDEATLRELVRLLSQMAHEALAETRTDGLPVLQ